jgi:hypothetical protein
MSSWFYVWNTRYNLLDILEGPATTQAQEGMSGPEALEQPSR